MAGERFELVDRMAAVEAIRRMNEEDLRFLNRLIVERLKFIAQARSTTLLARFSVGDPQVLDYRHFRESMAARWTRCQSAAIKAADPDALVTVGLIQWSVPALLPGVEHYSAFRPKLLAALLDFQEIHFYPLAAGFYDYKAV